MRSHDAVDQFRFEQLEQRRLFCGSFGDASGQTVENHLSENHVAAEVAPVGDVGSVGNAVSAFARTHRGARIVWGEATVIDGARVVTWALVSPHDDKVLAAGITMPMKLIENQPQQPGSGPAGAIASLQFPEIVQASTYFNHFELHTQPNGHPFSPVAANPNRYRAPHFDFHFYGIPEEQVRLIQPGPPAPSVPANLLPAGYAPPGPSELQMGRHSGPVTELSATDPWRAVMIAGFKPDGSQMHFVEPMITTAKLLEQRDFTLPMPMPSQFGRQTLYPKTFEAVFQGGAYHLVFSDFVHTDLAAATAPTHTFGVTSPTIATPRSQVASWLVQTADTTKDDQMVTQILG